MTGKSDPKVKPNEDLRNRIAAALREHCDMATDDHVVDSLNHIAAIAAEAAKTVAFPGPTTGAPYPPLHRWRIEILDDCVWLPCSRTFGARSLAVERYQSSSEEVGGEVVRRRLVRETTTYTVEQDGGAE